MTEYQKKIIYLEVVRQTFWEGKTIFCHTNSCQDFYERKKLQANTYILVLVFKIVTKKKNLLHFPLIWIQVQNCLKKINSLYICLQDRLIISFSVVNVTEKLRCCQLHLGHFFSMIGKSCLRARQN